MTRADGGRAGRDSLRDREPDIFPVMTRHPLRRALATIWACWFVLLVSEPALVHSCPMHDGAVMATAGIADAPPSSSAPTSGTATGSHEMAGHAEHAAHGAMAAGESQGVSEQPADQHSGGHPCTCLGDCSASAAIVVADAPRLAWLAGVLDVDVAIEAPEHAAPAWRAHVLPFANGPPSLTHA